MLIKTHYQASDLKSKSLETGNMLTLLLYSSKARDHADPAIYNY